MNDVVERVARRLAEENGFAWENCAQDQWRSDARAAIIETLKSLREPTEAMLETVKPWPAHWPKDGPDYPARHAAYLIDQATARSDWQSMIDAALADASPDIGKEGIGNDVR